jgi:glc operon protein GlcG
MDSRLLLSSVRQCKISEETFMSIRILTAALTGAMMLGFSAAYAQQPVPANPLDAIPEKLPFNVPYGAPITAERAEALIHAAVAEATKRGWPLNIAVVDSGANLVAFMRMDGAMLASIAVSQHKARTAVKYRRPSKVFEESVQKGLNTAITLDDAIASRGGIPLIEDGKLIGAIGCSGGTSSQDEAVCTAAVATLNK